MPDPAWERRQAERPDTWSLAFAGGSLTMAFGVDAVAFEAVLDRRPLVVVRDAEVPLPRSPASFGIRTEGLWADMNCEAPFEHWSYGLEAFGIAVDDPSDTRGHRIALGFDLEWEATAPVEGGEGSYRQSGRVHGEILVGHEAVAFDGAGVRRHQWGAAAAAATATAVAGWAGRRG